MIANIQTDIGKSHPHNLTAVENVLLQDGYCTRKVTFLLPVLPS